MNLYSSSRFYVTSCACMRRPWSCFVGCDSGAFDEIKNNLLMVAVFINYFILHRQRIAKSVYSALGDDLFLYISHFHVLTLVVFKPSVPSQNQIRVFT